MCKCFEYGRYARNAPITTRCAQTKNVPPISCQPRSVSTTSAIIARIRSASPRCEPLNRAGPHDLADHERRDDPGEHETREDVAQQAVPLGRRHMSARGRDRSEHDRREQHEEAPEDERVHEPRDEPLQQLALAEHDLDLVLDLPRRRPRGGRSAWRDGRAASGTTPAARRARRRRSTSTASAIAPMSSSPSAARR